jgi:hypothetical protein
MSSTAYVILFVALIIGFVMIAHIMDTHFKPKERKDSIKDVQEIPKVSDEVKAVVKPEPPKPKTYLMIQEDFDNLFKAIESRTLKELTRFDNVVNGVEVVEMLVKFFGKMNSVGMVKLDMYTAVTKSILTWSDFQALENKEGSGHVWKGDIREMKAAIKPYVFESVGAGLNTTPSNNVPVWRELNEAMHLVMLSKDGFVQVHGEHKTCRGCLVEMNIQFTSAHQRTKAIEKLARYASILGITHNLTTDNLTCKLTFNVQINTDLETTATMVLPMSGISEEALKIYEKAMAFERTAQVFRAYAKGDRNYGRLVTVVEGVDKLAKQFCLVLVSKDGFFNVMSTFDDVQENSILDYVPTEMLHEPSHATISLGQKQVIVSTF